MLNRFVRSSLPIFALAALALPIACGDESKTVTAAPDGGETPADTTLDGGEADAATSEPTVVDLGSVTTGTDVEFDVPEGAIGFNLIIEGQAADFDPQSPFGIERITDPKGKVVHDDYMPVGGMIPTSIAAFDTIAAVSVPQSESVNKTFPTGTWKARFGLYGNTSAKKKVKAKVQIQTTGDGTFHGGALDVHVHLPEGLEIEGKTVDAAKAASNAEIKERLDLFFQLTSELLGIERGEVTFHEEASSYVVLDDDEIIDGFAVSKGATDGTPGLHILYTNGIRQGGQDIAAGIAPGIPGAANVYGRGVSGIIVAVQRSAEEDALTMIHEAGHFIGLNHTTELDGENSDPLSDTDDCPGLTPQGLMQCPDRKNVMFVAGAIDGPVVVSPTQKRIYQGSPIYKAVNVQKTESRTNRSFTPKWVYRNSGAPLSPIERELAAGYCGLTKIDASKIALRHGRDAAIAGLRAAAHDADLSKIIRGRANLALKSLGVTP